MLLVPTLVGTGVALIDIRAWSDLTDFPVTIQSMIDCPTLSFYLTGSRFFDGAKDTSDWDVYMGYITNDEWETLSSWGFAPTNYPKERLFGGVLDVYSHTSEDIHLLEVENLPTRHRIQLVAQGLLLRYFPEGYTDKDVQAPRLWRQAEDVVAREDRDAEINFPNFGSVYPFQSRSKSHLMANNQPF